MPYTYTLNVDTALATYPANRPTKTVYRRGERGEDVEGGPLWSPVRTFYLNGIGPRGRPSMLFTTQQLRPEEATQCSKSMIQSTNLKSTTRPY